MKSTVALGFLALMITPMLFSDNLDAQTVSLTDRAWNAGAVTFNMKKVDGSRTMGQGYLVVRSDGVWIYTIGHVVDRATKVEIHIPGLWKPGHFQDIEIQRFGCDSGGDADPSCYFKVKEGLSDGILAGDRPLLPYVRAVPSAASGAFVGIPIPDSNRQWAVYGVSSIAPGQVRIRAVGFDDNSDGKADRRLGDLCQGNSGSPLVLLERDGLTFRPALTADGYAISVGELEGGFRDSSYDDPRGRKRRCFLNMIANHPGRSSTVPAIQTVDLVLE